MVTRIIRIITQQKPHSLSLHWVFLQSFWWSSSLLSPQSSSLSHLHTYGMHLLFAHLNWLSAHLGTAEIVHHYTKHYYLYWLQTENYPYCHHIIIVSCHRIFTDTVFWNISQCFTTHWQNIKCFLVVPKYLLQPFSSEPSSQFAFMSHFCESGIHLGGFVHLNWLSRHVCASQFSSSDLSLHCVLLSQIWVGEMQSWWLVALWH